MIIVLEGADLTGKTTMAGDLERVIKERTGREVERRHCGLPTDHPLNLYEQPLDCYDPMDARSDIIYDRHAWGEAVYGPILRGESAMDAAQLLHIELYLKSRGAVLVCLTQTPEELERRFNERGDWLIDASYIPAIVEGYKKLCGNAALDVNEIADPTRWDVYHTVDLAQQRETEVWWWHSHFPSYIGSVQPEVILLGDQPGGRAPQAKVHFSACFAPFESTSGHYLMETVLRTNLTRTVGLVNTFGADLKLLFEGNRQEPAFVALGTEAARRAEDAGIRHATVDHPQWVRRFKHYQQEEYATRLMEAVKAGEGNFTWQR